MRRLLVALKHGMGSLQARSARFIPAHTVTDEHPHKVEYVFQRELSGTMIFPTPRQRDQSGIAPEERDAAESISHTDDDPGMPRLPDSVEADSRPQRLRSPCEGRRENSDGRHDDVV
jgi:hypothetical protein